MANTPYNLAKIVSLTDFQPPFEKWSGQYTWNWQALVEEGQSKTMTKEHFGMVALPAAQERGVLEPAYYADISELDSTTITMVKYTLGTVVADETVLYNRHFKGLMAKLGAMFGRSHRYTLEAGIAEVFNNAFDSSAQAMYDSAALCDTHTLPSGDSLDNDLTASSITFDSFWTMVQYFTSSQRSHNGFYISENPKYILAHPSKQPDIEKILGSAQEPDTADNNVNTLKRFNIQPIYCRFLDSTKWFILSENWPESFPFYWVVKPQRPKTEYDLDRGGTKLMTTSIYGFGPVDFVSIVGNPGV